MANTSGLNKIREYVIKQMSTELGIKLTTKKLQIGTKADGTQRLKEFDGVSNDKQLIIAVANNSGYTSGNKLPTGKIKNVYALCYFLSLANASRKILVLTNEEFHHIFKKDSDGLLKDIELIYFQLPDNLKEIAKDITIEASNEMSR